MLRKRSEIQKKKTVSDEYIDEMLLRGTHAECESDKKKDVKGVQNPSSEENRSLFFRFSDSLNELKNEVKKVLVFRTSRFWVIDEVLSILKEKYPDTEISILAQPSVKEECEKNENINTVFTMKNTKKFGLFNAGVGTIKGLRKKEYDMIVTPLSSKGLSKRQLMTSQRNLHSAILGIRPKTVVFVDSEGTTVTQAFSPKEYFFDYFLSLKIFGFFLIKLMMVPYIVFMLAGVALSDSWGWLQRKLKGGIYKTAESK
jgi:hypothetical protein